MIAWIVTTGEPLPIDCGGRLHRAGMIAEALTKRGHEVVWWASTWDHTYKVLRSERAVTLTLPSGVNLRLLHGVPYTKNVSLARVWNHRQIAAQFYREAAKLPKPAVILTSFPTIELAERSATFGKEAEVPVVLDVRDLWPDIFPRYMAKYIQPLAPLLLIPLVRQARRAFRMCTCIIGISEGYLDFGIRYAERERRAQDTVFPLGCSAPADPPPNYKEEAAKLVGMGVEPQKTICWFVGTFGMTYDLATVIDGARLLESTFPDVQFVFSGRGPKFDEWSTRADGLRNVVFTGWLDSGGLAFISSVAKIGLAAYGPGAPQSLPNKVFEYLAAGLPIVSSLVGECEELLRLNDCGSSYVAGDPDSLLAALKPHLENEAYRARCGDNAARLFREQFQADVIYGRMADHLENIALEHSPTFPLHRGADATPMMGFTGRLDAIKPGDVAVPAGFQAFCWHPRLLQPFPPAQVTGLAPEKMLSWRHLIYFYLRALMQGMSRSYRIAVSLDRSGAVAGFALASGRDFRFPFMGPHDVQLGPVWIGPQYRGQGLAIELCRLALRDIPDHPARNVWWLTWTDNKSSERTARKLGLTPVGIVTRASLLGLPAPHLYRLAM